MMRYRQAKKILKANGAWPRVLSLAVCWHPSLQDVVTTWPKPLSRALLRTLSKWANEDMRRNPEVRRYFQSATFAVAG